MKNNFLNSWFKRTLFLILIGFIFFIIFFILKHCFFFSTHPAEEIKQYYPNYYLFLKTYFGGLIHFVGSNSIFLFYICFALIVFLFFRVIYNGLEKKSDFKIYSIVFFVLLIFCEIILRVFQFQPGIHSRYKYFHPVSKLWTYKSFSADENGILRVDGKVRNEVSFRISKNNPNYGGREYGEVYGLTKEYIDLIQGKTKNSFNHFLSQIKLKKHKTALDSSILNYVKCPINSEGFRGIDLKQYDSKKTSVLLLGDSFTFGHSAMPKTNSFADLLLTKGYIVYNTGISATDVAQYLAVAKKYIKNLKPDFVIVNFYIGNDVTYYKRKVIPYQPVFYCTNAGNLFSFYNGEYNNSQKSAYKFVLNQWEIPKDVCVFNRIMSQTVITSLSWGIMKKTGLFPYLENKRVQKTRIKCKKFKAPYCNEELKEIKRLCLKNNVKFILSSIPEIVSSDFKKARDIPDLFKGIEYNEMKVSELDYNLEDGHFNIQGHRKYAAYLHRIMKSKMN